jgi:hypothetical protein
LSLWRLRQLSSMMDKVRFVNKHESFKSGVWNKVDGRAIEVVDFFRNLHFQWWRVALVFKTGMDNLSSNFTCSKMKCIYVKRYQN